MEFQEQHKTAIVHPEAKIGKDVIIGPGAVIGEHVRLADKVQVGSHAVVEGYTTIGEGTRIFPHAVIGVEPQDLKYKASESYIEIGSNNTIREFVSIHPGTEAGEKTVIGNNNLLMGTVHIAHNCVVGNGVVLANLATLAGHVTVDDFVVIGGLTGVHQHVRIGCNVMVGGGTAVYQDVMPYCMLVGNPGKMTGLNSVGLKRHGFLEDERMSLKKAYKILFRQELSFSSAT